MLAKIKCCKLCLLLLGLRLFSLFFVSLSFTTQPLALNSLVVDHWSKLLWQFAPALTDGKSIMRMNWRMWNYVNAKAKKIAQIKVGWFVCFGVVFADRWRQPQRWSVHDQRHRSADERWRLRYRSTGCLSKRHRGMLRPSKFICSRH